MRTDKLHFADYKGHVTLEMLNSVYSQYGKTFDCIHAAKKFQEANPKSWLYKLTDYKHSDIEAIFTERKNGEKPKFKGIEIKKGAQKYCIGWLVQLAA